MACGFGLCFRRASCPVAREDGSGYDHLRACVEGPVFNPARVHVGPVAVGGADDAADAAGRDPRGARLDRGGGATVAGVKRTLAVDLAGLGMVDAGDDRGRVRRHGPRAQPGSSTRARSARSSAARSRCCRARARRRRASPRRPSAIVWETGLQNPGLDAFVAEELPRLARDARRPSSSRSAVARSRSSCGCTSAAAGPAGGRRDRGAPGGCPTTSSTAPVLGAHADRVGEVVGRRARAWRLVPVFAKLPAGARARASSPRWRARAGATGVTAHRLAAGARGRRRPAARDARRRDRMALGPGAARR